MRLCTYVRWPNLDKEIEWSVKQCDHCLAVKGNLPKAPLHPWIWPTRPWQRVHLDFAGPFCNKMFLISIDAHSKLPKVIETTATRTIAELRKLFASYCLPEQIVTDTGPNLLPTSSLTASNKTEFNISAALRIILLRMAWLKGL